MFSEPTWSTSPRVDTRSSSTVGVPTDTSSPTTAPSPGAGVSSNPSTRRARNARTMAPSVSAVSCVSASRTVYPAAAAARSTVRIRVAKYGFASREIATPIVRVPPVTSDRAMASPV